MNASLRALLTGLIDYAGLFPPAQLPLEEAIANDAAYRAGPDAWMLGRFVCPAARLKDLAASPPLSVVGRGGATAEDFFAGQRQDKEDLLALRQRRPDAKVDAYEVRLGNALLADGAMAHRAACSEPMQGIAAFYEVEYGANWSTSVSMLITELTESSERRRGLKIRCGGVTAASVPSTEHLTFALAASCKAGVPAKFTAGLHHPIRHLDRSLGTTVHGFLNVFVAGVLGHARRLSDTALQPILAEEDPASFHFDDSGLGWKDLNAATEEVAAARKRAVISFGSCSFDEPREDLRALGLLS